MVGDYSPVRSRVLPLYSDGCDTEGSVETVEELLVLVITFLVNFLFLWVQIGTGAALLMPLLQVRVLP